MLRSACNEEKESVGLRGVKAKYADSSVQAKVLTLLQQNEIEYIIENGYIVTLMKDTAEVRKIMRLSELGGTLTHLDWRVRSLFQNNMKKY